MTDHAPIFSTLLTHEWILISVISCGLTTILIPLNTLYLKLIWDLYILHNNNNHILYLYFLFVMCMFVWWDFFFMILIENYMIVWFVVIQNYLNRWNTVSKSHDLNKSFLPQINLFYLSQKSLSSLFCTKNTSYCNSLTQPIPFLHHRCLPIERFPSLPKMVRFGTITSQFCLQNFVKY